MRLWRTGISCYRPPLPLLASGTPTAPTAAPPVPRRAPSVENARMRPDRPDRLAVRFHALEEINALVHRIPGTMVQALAGTTDALNGGRHLPLRRWDLRFCYPRRWQPLPPGRRRREQLSTPLGAGSAAFPRLLGAARVSVDASSRKGKLAADKRQCPSEGDKQDQPRKQQVGDQELRVQPVQRGRCVRSIEHCRGREDKTGPRQPSYPGLACEARRK